MKNQLVDKIEAFVSYEGKCETIIEKDVFITISKGRNPKHHKLVFAMLGYTAKHMNKYDDLKVEYNTLEEETTEDIKQLKKVLEWYDNFVDYVQECNANIYNSACAYADDIE